MKSGVQSPAATTSNHVIALLSEHVKVLAFATLHVGLFWQFTSPPVVLSIRIALNNWKSIDKCKTLHSESLNVQT